MSSPIVKEQPALSSIKPNSKIPLSDEAVAVFFDCLCADVRTVEDDVVWVLPDVGYIDNVLSPDECLKLRTTIDASPATTFWSTMGRDNTDARAFRDADTVEFSSAPFAEMIWFRVRENLAQLNIQIAEVDDGNKFWRMGMIGTWKPTGLNSDLLLARYPSFGSFAPHTDGCATHNFNNRSFYSVIIFLNTIPPGNGGGTKFYTDAAVQQLRLDEMGRQWTADPTYSIGEIDAVSGRMLIFDQNMVHEGVPPTEGFSKYIIRSDVMFNRSPEKCTTPSDIAAFQLYLDAESAAESGHVDESIAMFRRAFKLSADLKRLLGHG